MSGWMDSFNQAVGFTDDPEDAKNKAIDNEKQASANALKLQRDQFDYQKQINQPFYDRSLPGYMSLVSAITGKPQQYNDPQYHQLEGRDAASEAWKKIQADTSLASSDFWKDVGHGEDPLGRIMRDGSLSQLTQGYYKGPKGDVVTDVPQLNSGTWKPQDTEAYKWQNEQLDKNMGRSLRALGRSNSTYGMNAMSDAKKGLAASEYDKQLGRLADLTNIARGGASTLANASTGFTNAAGQNMLNNGTNMANASLAGGMLKQNSLYNNQQNGMSLANLGLKTYDYGKQNGWWGGNDNGSLYNDAGGDINKVDFGSDWGNWSDGSAA